MARRAAGVPPVEMARRLGVQQPAINKAESGKGHLLERTVRRHAAALGMTVELVLAPRGGHESRVD